MKLIAKGNTAEVYDYEDNKICKLFYSGYSEDAIRREYNNAQIIKNENINIPVPICYGITKYKKR